MLESSRRVCSLDPPCYCCYDMALRAHPKATSKQLLSTLPIRRQCSTHRPPGLETSVCYKSTNHHHAVEKKTKRTSGHGVPGMRLASSSRFSGTITSQPAGPILHRKDDLHVANWNIRALQDVGVQALTMRELRKCYVGIARLSHPKMIFLRDRLPGLRRGYCGRD